MTIFRLYFDYMKYHILTIAKIASKYALTIWRLSGDYRVWGQTIWRLSGDEVNWSGQYKPAKRITSPQGPRRPHVVFRSGSGGKLTGRDR